MQKLTLATLSTLALSLACSSVFAVDGTIRVNGVVTDQTCTLQGYDRITTGLKDITVRLPSVPKSTVKPTYPLSNAIVFMMKIANADGTDFCDAVTSKAFKGIHLSASPTNLDATDKTLLVNKATGASIINPVFIQINASDGRVVDFSAPWGTQAKSRTYPSGSATTLSIMYLAYYFSKTGIVDAQNVTATVNYTMHYN